MSTAGRRGTDREAGSTRRLEAALETLAEEVAKLRSGQDWQRFLRLQTALHAYSPNNVMLIVVQHALAFAQGVVRSPDPGHVAGFHTWRALGRSVERGQHGYMVLAPCRYERHIAIGTDGQARALGKGEAPAAGETVEPRRVLAGFRVEHVFSVHQTSGAELPEPPRPQLLAGEAPAGLGDIVRDLIEKQGFNVGTVPVAAAIGGANGLTRWDTRTVLVRADMDDAAIVKTLVHEAAHVLLHAEAPGRYSPRAQKEVEAESVAYVVGAAHGMQTSGYSFPYVAAWAGDDGTRVVQAAQASVARAARAIIDASTAVRLDGGRPPGATAAIAAAQAARGQVVASLEPSVGPGAGPVGL
jgi:hypothetical protein